VNYEARLEYLKSVLRTNGLEAAFLTRRGALGYYTGAFIPWCSALFVPVSGEPELITQRYDIGRVIDASYIKKMRGWTSDGDISFPECVIQEIKEQNLETAAIGFEMDTAEVGGVLTALEYLQITAACPKIRIENVIKLVNSALAIRDIEEIELLRRAAEAADAAMSGAFRSLYVGMPETELAGVVEYEGRKAGSMFNWSVTGTEIGSGYRQAYPNCYTVIPSHKRIQYGDLVTIDLHTMYDLYLADLALNAVMGPPNEQQKQLAKDWKTLSDYLLSLIKPDAKACEIANLMLKKAEQLGVRNCVSPLFGHGLGVEVRIPPTLTQESPHILKENMTMVAVLQLTDPAVGGMRLEVPILITKRGAECLCKTPLELFVKEVS
jgi:Xaa-Pro aminopeptidase